jgi:hypothetical protein
MTMKNRRQNTDQESKEDGKSLPETLGMEMIARKLQKVHKNNPRQCMETIFYYWIQPLPMATHLYGTVV